MTMTLITGLVLHALVATLPWQAQAPGQAQAAGGGPLQPGHASARANAHRIFNAVHSAGRQWGSSLHHNGMSLFPVVMPRGTLLYHGAATDETPAGLEWLALDAELSEAFALSSKLQRLAPRPKSESTAEDRGQAQKPLRRAPATKTRGYLQTYRARRALNLVYFDGMSAAKTSLGTLDMQDLVMRGNRTSSSLDEADRARDICELVTAWGYDGLVRMELGFEVVYCDFGRGIDLVASTRAAHLRDETPDSQIDFYQWARAVGESYDGVTGRRLRIDFSSMVSAFFFPVDTANTVDPARQDLPRLAAAGLDELRDMRAHARRVLTGPRSHVVDWQAVVDLVVGRFSSRLALMAAPELAPSRFVDEVEVASRTYFDGPPEDVADVARNRTAEAVDACTKHYLLPTYLARDDWSLEDELLHSAMETVLSGICNKLFLIRALVLAARDEDGALDKAVEAGRGVVHSLREELDWTTWKRPEPCPVDQVLFTAMWPLGEPRDHWRPGCRPSDAISIAKRGYWSGHDEL